MMNNAILSFENGYEQTNEVWVYDVLKKIASWTQGIDTQSSSK